MKSDRLKSVMALPVQYPRPAVLCLRAVLFLQLLRALTQVAAPAPAPWVPYTTQQRAAAVRTPPLYPTAARTSAAAEPAAAADPARPRQTTPTGRDRGRRGGSRRRGRRGGANWRRHGETSADQFIIGHLNIQSMKPKMPDLCSDIHRTYGFDVMALAETWLTPNVPDRLLTVSGYKLYRSDRPSGSHLPKGKGGVAVLVRDCYKCEQLKTPFTGDANSNLEIVWVLIHVSKHQSLLVASAYRVPSNTTRQVTADLESLENQIQFMLVNYPRSTLVVAGDFNCCLFKARESVRERLLPDLFETYGLSITNRDRPTYRPANSLLDVIATSRPDLVRRTGVTRCHFGGPHDFTRVILERQATAGSADRPRVERRCFGRVDVAAFNRQLYECDWSGVFLRDGPDSKWRAFCELFIRQLDTVAPLRRVTVRPAATPPVSADTQELLRRRRAALTRGSRDDYRGVNRLCKAAIRADCRAFYQEQITRGGKRSLWRVLQPVIGRKQQHADPPTVTPDALNDYYVTIGPATAAGVPRPTHPSPCQATPRHLRHL